MKPKSVICVRSDSLVIVCGWCPDKDAGDLWASIRGSSVSHGVCDYCKAGVLKPDISDFPTTTQILEANKLVIPEISTTPRGQQIIINYEL